MKVTVLGCGSSGGVPLLGGEWGNCNPNDPRNARLRVSILVEVNGKSILIDTSPDMRQQLLHRNMSNLAAVLYTHSHADHCHGVDELRSVNWQTKQPVPVYADPKTMDELNSRFPYIFNDPRPGTFYRPSIIKHIIDGPFEAAGVKVIPFMQDHGYSHSIGYRIGDFAYSTDVKSLDDAAFDALRGVKTWIVDCVREEEHPTHAHFVQTLEWIARVKPERAFLTHMNQTLDYEATKAKCPPGVLPAHDGLVLEC